MLSLGVSLNRALSISSGSAQFSKTKRVAASEDDARELFSTGAVDIASSTIYLGFEGTTHRAHGFRFTGLNIPNGAQITSAKISFTSRFTRTGETCDLIISAEKGSDPVSFTTTTNDITNRTHTTANVNWTVPPWSTDENGADTLSPDFATVLQEVIDDSSYNSTHALVVFVDSDQVTANSRSVKPYDLEPNEAPELQITYKTVVSINKKISASSDDARELDFNSNYLDSFQRIDLGYLATRNRYSGWRFTNLNIPDGATIVSAYIQFSAFDSKLQATAGTTDIYIRGEIGRNPPTFSVSDKMSQRTWGTVEVPWSINTDWFTDDRTVNQRTPELKTVIQEIIDNVAYNTGDAMAFLIDNNDTVTGVRNVSTFDNVKTTPSDHYAELFITYIT